jgi:hypothetical protein
MVLQRHGRALQNLDAARQIPVHLSAILGSKDRFAAVDWVTMQELRSRPVRRSSLSGERVAISSSLPAPR